jgi:hypothetical protein
LDKTDKALYAVAIGGGLLAVFWYIMRARKDPNFNPLHEGFSNPAEMFA